MLANPEDIQDFKNQLRKGSLQRAYRALIDRMNGLRTHFAGKYGDSAVSALYQGYMDMTYFAVFPAALKQRDLKVAIVFNYGAFRFEAWLAARNRQLQQQYWQLFKQSEWGGYRVVAPGEGIDSILECDLVDGFDPADPERLTSGIDSAAAEFIGKIERFLAEHPSPAG